MSSPSPFSSLQKIFSSPTRVVILIIVLLVVWMISGLFKCSSLPKEGESILPEKPLFHVEIMESDAQEKEITLSLTGQTRANRSLTISAKTPGTIEKFLIDRGSLVEADTLLATLDPATRLIQLKEAQSFITKNEHNFHVQKELKQKGFGSKTALSDAQANLSNAEVKKESILKDLEYTKIKAPFKGIIDHNFVEVGSYVDVGDKLFTLLELDPLLATAAVSENYVNDIHVGNGAKVKFSSGLELEGIVKFKSSNSSDKTHAFQVEISLRNPSYEIPSGQTVQIKIPLRQSLVHIVPSQILSLRTDGTLALRHVSSDNRVIETPIQIVFSDGENVWVQGLPSHVRLIKTGQEFVIPDQVVDIQSPSPDASPEKAQE